eukprot:589517-Prorocentrum_lima.AAC.1
MATAQCFLCITQNHYVIGALPPSPRSARNTLLAVPSVYGIRQILKLASRELNLTLLLSRRTTCRQKRSNY